MADLQFEEEQNLAQRPSYMTEESQMSQGGLTGWATDTGTKLGLIKDPSQANYFLIGFAVILIIAAFIAPSVLTRKASPLPPPELVDAAFRYSPVNNYRL